MSTVIERFKFAYGLIILFKWYTQCLSKLSRADPCYVIVLFIPWRLQIKLINYLLSSFYILIILTFIVYTSVLQNNGDQIFFYILCFFLLGNNMYNPSINSFFNALKIRFIQSVKYKIGFIFIPNKHVLVLNMDFYFGHFR